MKNCKKFDERQLAIRGAAFKWTTLMFIIWIMIWNLLKEFQVIQSEPTADMLIEILPPFCVFAITCILKDAYDPISGRPGLAVFVLMPLCAVTMYFSKIRDHVILFDGNLITTDGALIINYTVWILLAVIYWTKYLKERSAEKNPTDQAS